MPRARAKAQSWGVAHPSGEVVSTTKTKGAAESECERLNEEARVSGHLHLGMPVGHVVVPLRGVNA